MFFTIPSLSFSYCHCCHCLSLCLCLCLSAGVGCNSCLFQYQKTSPTVIPFGEEETSKQTKKPTDVCTRKHKCILLLLYPLFYPSYSWANTQHIPTQPSLISKNTAQYECHIHRHSQWFQSFLSATYQYAQNTQSVGVGSMYLYHSIIATKLNQSASHSFAHSLSHTRTQARIRHSHNADCHEKATGLVWMHRNLSKNVSVNNGQIQTLSTTVGTDWNIERNIEWNCLDYKLNETQKGARREWWCWC